MLKGTYSSHGLELIMLTYEEDVNKVKAIKISVSCFRLPYFCHIKIVSSSSVFQRAIKIFRLVKLLFVPIFHSACIFLKENRKTWKILNQYNQLLQMLNGMSYLHYNPLLFHRIALSVTIKYPTVVKQGI